MKLQPGDLIWYRPATPGFAWNEDISGEVKSVSRSRVRILVSTKSGVEVDIVVDAENVRLQKRGQDV